MIAALLSVAEELIAPLAVRSALSALLQKSGRQLLLRELRPSYRQTGNPMLPRVAKTALSNATTKVGGKTLVNPPRSLWTPPAAVPPPLPKPGPPPLPAPALPALPTPGTPPPLPTPRPSPGPVSPPSPAPQPGPGQHRDLPPPNQPPGPPIQPSIPIGNALPAVQILDALNNLNSKSQNLAGTYFPRIIWTGDVKASGFKTTPTRTVLHYALAVAFGLMRQVRIGSVALVVKIDYKTNTVFVSYTSQTSMLTEIISLGMLIGAGKVLSPQDLANLAAVGGVQGLGDAFGIRSLIKGVVKIDPTTGIADVAEGNLKILNGIIDTAFNVYQNVGRALGPLAMWDMTLSNQIDRDKKGDPVNNDETIYGGLPSMFLTPPPGPDNQNRIPRPFGDMMQQPLLTRNDAPNPQPPAPMEAARGADKASGYSLDLRSLVAQAIYDPGILPPKPDTNVSLDPVYDL